MGWVEFVMSRNQEDIKMELTLALIKAGVQESALINKTTEDLYQNIIQKSKPKEQMNGGSYALGKPTEDYVDELIEKQRADAKIALKIIQQYQFTTLTELVHQITLVAYGEVNTIGSCSK